MGVNFYESPLKRLPGIYLYYSLQNHSSLSVINCVSAKFFLDYYFNDAMIHTFKTIQPKALHIQFKTEVNDLQFVKIRQKVVTSVPQLSLCRD